MKLFLESRVVVILEIRVRLDI